MPARSADLKQTFFDAVRRRDLAGAQASLDALRSRQAAPAEEGLVAWVRYFEGILANERDQDLAAGERIFLEVAQRADADLELQGRLFLALALTCCRQNRLQACLDYSEHSLVCCRARGDNVGQAKALKQGVIARATGFDQGLFGPDVLPAIEQQCRQALALLEDVAPTEETQWLAGTLWNEIGADHLSVDAMREQLQRIRQEDDHNLILVITEGLFSMDADMPDIAAIQATCREFDAVLLVDIAHDFGSMGPGGTGALGLQDMLGRVDLVMGSFSKTFASNGGFVAANSPAVKQYLKFYGGPHIFSNALSPVQCAVVSAALRIVRSSEGDALRDQLLQVATTLRGALHERGIFCLGVPSPITPVVIGEERVAAVSAKMIAERGVLANLVEYPAVPLGKARFRMQAMATHTAQQAQQAAGIVADAVHFATSLFGNSNGATP